MPIYEVEHVCSLSDSQQDKIADAITKIHSEKFTTPTLFVNVRFTNIATHNTYVGGKRRKSNRIIANVRHGPSRTRADYDDVCAQIMRAWAQAVGTMGDDELRAIFIVGGLIAASEAGFSIPPAGGDAQWLKENVGEFRKLAQSGDQDFQDLMSELQQRDAFKGIMQTVT